MTRREFPKSVRLAAWGRCGGNCEQCHQRIKGTPIYDHITPDAVGGDPVLSNCKVLCVRCNRVKTYEKDIPEIARSTRILEKRIGLRDKRRGFRGWKNMKGEPVWRSKP